MNSHAGLGDSDLSEQLIVRADEIDQTGTDISTIPDSQLLPELVQGFKGEPTRISDGSHPPELLVRHIRDPGRPELRRDAVAPPPPLQPPPPTPVQQNVENPMDSLSLVQLRKIVQDMPKTEQPAYAFEYADCQPFPEELDEWFRYNETDRLMLLGSKISFEQKWASFCQNLPNMAGSQPSWLDASYQARKSFVDQMMVSFNNPDLFTRIEALESLCYVITGVWGITAGRTADDYPSEPSEKEAVETPKAKSLQIQWIVKNVLLLQECSAIPPLLGYMSRVFDKDQKFPAVDLKVFETEDGASAYFAARERETNLILTALYIVVEVARRQLASPEAPSLLLRDTLTSLNSNILVLLVEIIARLRWDDSTNIPLTRIILLFWKSLLLVFGGSEILAQAKTELEPRSYSQADPASRASNIPVLTASPLDYHLFRQEITSKYPAYNPPAPLVPLELENNSILPPLPSHSSRFGSSSGLFSGIGPSSTSGNGSILHQSVHIATPAPSPPPSPMGPGGKAGKKQNYQTNQNFPFMYPPLDGTSNNIGGKGTSSLQDILVGKKWEGSDVPASIIEAGNLFSSRMKMTRAMRQLWEERERFMKFDRGWDSRDSDAGSIRSGDDDSADTAGTGSPETKTQGEAFRIMKETDNESVQRCLVAVEDFYRKAMPHLQSIVIVLLKVILTNVTAIAAQSNMNGQNSHLQSNGVNPANGHPQIGQNPPNQELEGDAEIDDLDNIRLREITAKAVSGSLLLILKWFKRSHILKFEYMTQLLLDSNYLPLILKMFIHQDVDKVVAQKNDREDQSFFHFCHLHSDQPPEFAAQSEPDSEDEAAPPPIPRRRRSQGSFLGSSFSSSPEQNPEQQDDTLQDPCRPEVDELGCPTAPIPNSPITRYSFRNFFSSINFLHIMQKITRGKAHRCLLLVQYKSSNILRKGIKIPDPHLRLYTLKLFKSQVPYCGRKWRQSNMRVITAIYLYCRPELRDDWLAGSDVDAEVEESLPLEQALRGLTHWWHLRRYHEAMGIEKGTSLMDEERDFFARELENMDWGLAGDEMANGIGDEGDAAGGGNGSEWDGGPLQMEGW